MSRNQSQNQEDDFYSELDEKTENSSCCTCQTMAILFTFLLIITIIFSVFIGRELKNLNWKFWQKYSIKNTETISNKLKNVDNIQEIELVFTSEELTALVNKGLSNLYFEIKNPKISIFKDKMILTGELSRPIKSNISIDLLPEVKNEKVYFKITKITANDVSLPSLLNGEVEKVLNSLIDSQFKTIYDKYSIISVGLDNDKLIIKGKIKEDL